MPKLQALTPSASLSFGEHTIHLYEHDGKVWITSTELGKALGYNDPGRAMPKIYDRHQDELTPHSITVKVTDIDSNQVRRHRLYDEPGAYLVTMFAGTARAKEVRLWLANLPKAHRELKAQSHARLATKEERRPLVDLVRSWVSVAPLGYGAAHSQVNALFGVQKIDQMTVEQVEEAVEWVKSRIEEAHSAPVAEKPVQSLAAFRESLKKERARDAAAKFAKMLPAPFDRSRLAVIREARETLLQDKADLQELLWERIKPVRELYGYHLHSDSADVSALDAARLVAWERAVEEGDAVLKGLSGLGKQLQMLEKLESAVDAYCF